MTTLGTHNLLDGAAPPTGFAHVVFYTEALGRGAALYDTYVCEQQPDLVISVHKNTGWQFEEHYLPAHWGARKVTPNRGTFYLVDHVAKVVLIDEHRINAAFPPYIRGEKLFRKLAWQLHTRNTLKIIKRYKKLGYTIHAGGDLNTPKGVSGYKGHLYETGEHFDRLGSTRPFVRSMVLSKLGSDHFRLKGWC